MAKVATVGLLGLSEECYEKFCVTPPKYIIGVDEVGRGALAGPVTVCAFLAPIDWALKGLRDSKKLSADKREEFFDRLKESRRSWAVHSLEGALVDRWGTNQTIQLAMEECLEELRENYPECFEASLIVADGGLHARYVEHATFPKADDIVPQVSAASVLAKVTRDRYMSRTAHRWYPFYGFDKHVGYGTEVHMAALSRYGLSPIHRKTFVKEKNL